MVMRAKPDSEAAAGKGGAEAGASLGVADYDKELSYTARLARRLENDPPKRKGERTRERMKLAAAQVLERVGLHAMRVSDITAAAESSDGAFYIYFTDKKDVTLTVLHEFLSGMQLSWRPRPGGRRAVFKTMRAANLGWITTVKANAGLMRCVFQMSDEDSEFGRLVHAYNRQWYERIAKSVIDNHPAVELDASAALFAAWALGGMMDELMRRLVIYPDPTFIEFLEKTAPDAEALADALTVMWMRVLYPEAALPRALKGLAGGLAAFGSSPVEQD